MMRRFAWYGRLSTKDKQDPTLSFPSQRESCATKAAELGGEIVCEFTDQEAGRRDDRAGWADLLREAKEPDARRFDAVIIYSTSRLSRDLFHALTYEREMIRAGIEVFYALTAGDQTSPEGRLIRHMFQALDQFEVEKLGREVRRGQKENTRQGYRNGGRAPCGYRLQHEAHPDPARAKAGDTKSRLVPDPERAPVIAEIFDLFLSGSGYKEIANHLNRPGGPPTPNHVDSKRNTSGKWAKTTIKSMLENPTYTGRLYWNRLDSRAHKQGVGPVVRRSPEEWVEADERHEALITDEQFERAQAEMKRRSNGHGGRRRRPQKRPYMLRGIVHCATGHNPLRMQGRARKGEPTYYTCGYRTSYGDRAAEAVGHGKWQYVREDSLVTLIDTFFASRIFGADRLAHFRAQSSMLASEVEDRDDDQRARIAKQVGEVEQRIERQLAAIEAGVDPVLVGERIRNLKAEREEAQAALGQLEASHTDSPAVEPADALAVIDALPDLGKSLIAADPDVRRAVFDAFQLRVEIDRNDGRIRLKALVSSAFGEATNLSDLGEAGDPALSVKAIPLRGFEPRFPDLELPPRGRLRPIWFFSVQLMRSSSIQFGGVGDILRDTFLGRSSDLPGGRVLESLVSHLDIYPTICELAGIEEPPWLQGTSLMPVVRGETAKVNDAIFAEMTYHAAYQPLRAVRTERFKYIRRFSDYDRPVLANCDDSASKTILIEAGWGEQRVPEEQLFDLLFDPNELNDLSADPSRQQILSEMRERLPEWMRATEDPLLNGPVPEPPGAWSNDPAQASPNDPTSAAESE